MSVITQRARIRFDSKNPNHIKTYWDFVKTGKWKDGCPFMLEWPFFDIPTMIKTKVVEDNLSILINALSESRAKINK